MTGAFNPTTNQVTLPIQGDNTALENVEGAGTFDLTAVRIVGATGARSPLNPDATVMYVPDPDNSENTIFWVRDVLQSSEITPSGQVVLQLTYPPE